MEFIWDQEHHDEVVKLSKEKRFQIETLLSLANNYWKPKQKR
ncbi:hypothetical protein SAMN05444360_104240 [Chryseobacterium carnipullorum]|nr:hypothetical protein SAMN05444360_104240 [Chryseobacterium carnipullorum]